MSQTCVCASCVCVRFFWMKRSGVKQIWGMKLLEGEEQLPTFLNGWAVLEAGGLGGRLGRISIRIFAGVDGHNHVFHA